MKLNADDLRTLITGKLGVEDPFENDTPLFSAGILDSFNLLELIVFIEKAEGIKVKPTEVKLENLDSLDRMLQFIARKHAS